MNCDGVLDFGDIAPFGELLTKYYPCSKGYNRWKIVVACIT